MNKVIADSDLIQGLKQGDAKIIRLIYSQFAGKVQQWVLSNSGNTDDARDVFQEGLQTLYEMAIQSDFQLRSSFEGLLFTLCKRKWYGVLRKKKRWQGIRDDESLTPDVEDDNVESALIQQEEKAIKARKMATTFAQLSELCQRLLKLYAEGLSPEEIADSLEMSGRNAVYQRRKACADRWKVLMKQIA